MTIKDIAKESGVAIGTVSRVLNNHPDVSDVTRAKVQSVIDKYGFVLNKNAKQLKAQNSNTIVILVKGTSNLLLNELQEVIHKKMEQLPYSSVVTILDEYDNEVEQAVNIYYERKPIGIIFLGGSPEAFKDSFEKIKVPSILISNQAHSVNNSCLSSVSIDDFDASKSMIEHLIKNGHKNIAVIGGELESSELSANRFRGVMKAFEEAGISFNKETDYFTAKYSFEGGYNAAKAIVDSKKKYSAVFTMSDMMAIGACRQFSDAGFSIPDDYSVTGFDGLSMAAFYSPRITTIRQKVHTMVNAGLDLLLKNLNMQSSAQHIFIPFDFIEGESVKNLNN